MAVSHADSVAGMATDAGLGRRIFVLLAFPVLIGLVLLTQVDRPPAAIAGWRIATLFVVFGLGAMGLAFLEREAAWLSIGGVTVAGFWLVQFAARYRGDAFPIGEPTVVSLGIVFLALAVFATGFPDPRQFSADQWILVAAFGAVVALFFVHTVWVPDGGRMPTWPVWAAMVATVAFLVLPRFVPEAVFLWTVALFAAGAGIVGVLAFSIGEFGIWAFEITVQNQDFPFTATDIASWQGTTSIFNNLNVFGLTSFAGFAAASTIAYRAAVRGAPFPTLAGIGLALLTATGLVLSSSDASWLAAVVFLVTLGSYAAFGRAGIVGTLVVGAIGSVLVIAGVYIGAIPLDDGGRFDRWRSAIRAMRAAPATFGHGHISTAAFTEPYLETGGANTPHNSYLSMLIRTGVVGLAAYLVVIVGGIVARTLVPEDVNAPMIAFALGWAFHHLFESYSMIQWTIPAVLSAMTFGYLIFGRWHRTAAVS